MSYMSSKPSSTTTVGGPVTATKSLFWTVYYFFYFLLTGQPEWKCESHQHEPLIACCGRQANEENANFKWNSSHSAASSRSNGHFHEHYQQNGHRHPSGPREGIVGRVKRAMADSWNWLKRAGCWIGQKAVQGVKLVGKGLGWVWDKLKAVWNYFRSIQLPAARSKSLPPSQIQRPKPFCPDSPSFNKVVFDPEATFQVFKHNMDASIKDQLEETLQPKNYQQEEDFDERTLREPSVPPPPPPPPQKPIRIERSVEPPEVVARITAPLSQIESYHERKEEKKEHKVSRGVPEMAKEVMAELSGRLSRGPSAQREMTQSCHPDMPEWKDENRYDRSGSATPWRASSVGPTMRRLEQVVSRLDPQDNEASDNEAQYVFRPPPTRPADYQMGRSVFNPLEEAERMRESINKKSHQETRGLESRPVTPSSYYTERKYNGGNELRQRAKTVEPSQSYVRPFTPSLAYSSAPFTSHTARRSKTPISFDRGNNFAYDRNEISDGVVNNTARRWPPVSNATGAPVERDNWLHDIMGRSDDDGLITTMCRRVVERKTEDNWKWRDETGRLVDEQNQRKWKGELDTVVRDGPEQGRQWSRTVEVNPNGTTLFQDVSRQYDRDYVVESVVRNY